MSNSLSKLIDSFVNLKILVVGDVMLDCYLEGATQKLSREAPVPVVEVSIKENMPGGAANAAVNAAKLGATVDLLSVRGADPSGQELSRYLQQNNVNSENLLVHPQRQTLTKKRVVSGAQMLLRFDEGSAQNLDEVFEKHLIERLQRKYSKVDAVLISDYASGILTANVIEAIAQLQKLSPQLLIVDSRRLLEFKSIGATVIKPNFAETCKLLGATSEIQNDRTDFVVAHAEKILELTRAKIAAVTLDAEGAIIIEQGKPAHRTYTPPRRFVNATGAGDTFASAFTLALAAGAHTPAAAELASAAAALVVEKMRTATCSSDELREHVLGEDKTVLDLSRLASKVKLLRAGGKRIVFTNGCFDILHRGHITYLNRAKELGDVLVVGVNSDASVRRLKSAREQNRPINTLEDRLQVLSALSCVDFLIAFEENSPVEIIEAVRPDVYVKGGDYTLETLPETPVIERIGGQIEILPYLEDHSTTGIIERIRQAYTLAN